MIIRSRLVILLALLLMLTSQNAVSQSSWARFRGPNGAGIADGSQQLPINFDETQNAIWNTKVSQGHSSPCIWGNRVFLTGQNDGELETLCLNRDTGKILWRKAVPEVETEKVHKVNSLASPTPAADGERVYVYFGSYGLLCYDFAGNEVWKRPFKKKLRNTFGTGSSPILANNFLIFSCDNNTDSFIEAIHKESGEIAWRKTREGFKSSWSTPIYWNNNGTDELLVYGIWWLSALDLKDGSDRWAVPGLADEPAVTPVIGDGLVFVSSYNMKTNTEVIGLPEYNNLLKQYDKDNNGQISFEEGKENKSVLSRYDADGEGDHPLRLFYRFLDIDHNEQISDIEYKKLVAWIDGFKQENGLIAIRPAVQSGGKAEVAWRYGYGVPEIPSPLYYQGRLYLVKNGGIVTCLNAKTGEKKYQARLGAGGPYYASPIVGDGKVYATSARGVVTVFGVGDTLKILARNDLKERIMATPAIVDGKLYVRTGKRLYAFGL